MDVRSARREDHAKFVCCDVVNRGVALYRGRVYVGALDGRLIALDAKTGRYSGKFKPRPRMPYAITAAPRIAKGRVLIGNAGSEYAVRGYVSAYDAETGNLIWRTYNRAGDPSKPFESEAMRRAAATWSGEWWKAGGGGKRVGRDGLRSRTRLRILRHRKRVALVRPAASKGDDLYVASIVALRADNGEQVWHLSDNAGRQLDYDATQPLMLATLTIDGQQRRVVMQANKNGFFYVSRSRKGALISAHPVPRSIGPRASIPRAAH